MKWLESVLGSDNNFLLDKMALNAILLCSAIFGAFSFISDLLLQPGLIITSISFSVMASFGTLYFLGRKKSNYKLLVIPYLLIYLLFIVVIWLVTGGTDGPGLIYFVALMFIAPIITKNQFRIYVMMGLFLFIFTLFFVELKNPSIVQNIYNDPSMKKVDTFASVIYLSIVAFIVMTLVILSYEKQKEKAENLNKAKNQFFSIISHDLKGPISSLINLGQMLLEKDEELEEKYKKEIIKHIYNCSKETHHLLDNLLNWARTKSNDLTLKPEEVSLIDCIDLTSRALMESIRQKKIELHIDIADDHGVYADKNMLMTVIRNLLSNAIKFTNIGGQISISTQLVKPDMIQIKITDNGRGIPEGMRANLFDRNEFLRNEGTNNEVGTGLGLSICKNFIQKNKGEISVESELEKGSTFLISLPTREN